MYLIAMKLYNLKESGCIKGYLGKDSFLFICKCFYWNWFAGTPTICASANQYVMFFEKPLVMKWV